MKKILFLTVSIVILTMGFIACNSSTPDPGPLGPFPSHLVVVEGAYYLAPDGCDATGDGTIEKPWFTFNRVQQVIMPGDTVYLRGGRFMIDDDTADNIVISSGETSIQNIGYAGIVLWRSGERGKPITYAAYPPDLAAGNRPIIDFSNWDGVMGPKDGISGNAAHGGTTNWPNYRDAPGGIVFGGKSRSTATGTPATGDALSADWIHLYGFDVTGIETDYDCGQVFFIWRGSHNTLENLRIYENGAKGLFIPDAYISSYNLIKNVDSFNNRSKTSFRANGSIDGFGMHLRAGSIGNVFYGCRAWLNGDDGFDIIQSAGQVIIDNCWAAFNGYGYIDTYTNEMAMTAFDTDSMFRLDNGLGIKAGGWNQNAAITRPPFSYPRHVVRYSLAVGNPHSGITTNHEVGTGNIYVNNTAYNNAVNFQMMHRGSFMPTHWANPPRNNVNAFDTTMRNNISWPGPLNGVTDASAYGADYTGAKIDGLGQSGANPAQIINRPKTGLIDDVRPYPEVDEDGLPVYVHKTSRERLTITGYSDSGNTTGQPNAWEDSNGTSVVAADVELLWDHINWAEYHVSWLDINSGIIENNSWSMVDNGGSLTNGIDLFEGVNVAMHNGTTVMRWAVNWQDQVADIVQNALNLTDDDFVSLDMNLFLTPRNADGSLPDINLVRPRPSSAAFGIGYTAPDVNRDGFGNRWKMAGARPTM